MRVLQINTVADHGSVPGTMRQLHDAVTAGHGEKCKVATFKRRYVKLQREIWRIKRIQGK